MPVREPDMLEIPFIFNGKETKYKIHRQSYEASEKLKKDAPEHNDETSKAAQRIQEGVNEIPGMVTVITRPFKKLVEGLGLEFKKPRNYLTNEVIEVTSASGEKNIFFWGEYLDIPSAEVDIIKRIKNNDYERKLPTREPAGGSGEHRRVPKPGVGESGGECITDISAVRLQFRKRKLPGNT